MLKAENITYTVGNATLLKNVSVEFKPGQLNLIIGPNGAGKSTLIKILSGQLKPTEGTVSYHHTNLHTYTVAEQARMRAVLSQNVELAFPMTAEQVVMMGRYPHFTGKPTEKDYTAVTEAMQFFDVQGMAQRNYLTLSGGERQRVHFARVMAQIWYAPNPGYRYLLLDEPLTFLDAQYQFSFMRQVMELLKDKNLVVAGVVHDLNLAARFADNITLLHNAQLLANGPKEEVLTREHIKTAYQLEPLIHHQRGHMYLFFE